jgi:hypothetical protein
MTYIAFQQEHGGAPNFTPHLQGYCQMAKPVDIKLVTKFLTNILGTPVHTEATMGTNIQANDYCTREFCESDPEIRKRDEGTYAFTWGQMIEHGSKRKAQGKRTDLEAVREAINSGTSLEDLQTQYFREFAMYGRFLTQYHTEFHQRKVQEEMQQSTASVPLRPWQTACLTICQTEPSTRKVRWFWENVGNVGKSWMARYLALHHSAIVVGAMKKADLLHAITKLITGKTTVIFDLTRSTEEGAVKVVYEVLEQLSNRVIFSGKYDSQTVWIPQVHLLVFANFEPDRSAMSADRWDVHHIASV